MNRAALGLVDLHDEAMILSRNGHEFAEKLVKLRQTGLIVGFGSLNGLRQLRQFSLGLVLLLLALRLVGLGCLGPGFGACGLKRYSGQGFLNRGKPGVSSCFRVGPQSKI